MNIIPLLIEKGVLGAEDAANLEKEVRASGKPLEEALLELGIDETTLVNLKAEQFGVPGKVIGEEQIAFEILKYIPEESAMHYRFAPLRVEEGVLEVGMTDPENIEARDALNFISSKLNIPFKIFLISEKDFGKILDQYKGLSGEVHKALSEIEASVADGEFEVSGERKPDEVISSTEEKGEEGGKREAMITEDAPVTKIVATILRYATEGDASDIHIEPSDDRMRVRFRVDGTLTTSLVLPMKVHRAVVARVKILSSMKLDENRKPQDGRFTARIEGKHIDFRVSTFPTYYGEKVEMRILDPEKGVRPLSEIGLSPSNLALIRAAIDRPYGMILISGPTGSGKTTTLYSMLNEVDREHENVLSLEDPVEYNIAGMNQSQVRPEIGYTFATGLRSTLRQDPDIIMVGEIRDRETAQLAVQAALTGHLVLSTIHTNDAIGVVPRLLDMGIDPYLIPPTLILAIAQRLVRTLCPGGGKPMAVEGSFKAMLDSQFADLPPQYRNALPPLKEIRKIEPTTDCPNGTRGRMAVFEVLEMAPSIEHFILKGKASEEEMLKAARERGFLTMKEDAILKSAQGLIPFEEVNTLGGDVLATE